MVDLGAFPARKSTGCDVFFAGSFSSEGDLTQTPDVVRSRPARFSPVSFSFILGSGGSLHVVRPT